MPTIRRDRLARRAAASLGIGALMFVLAACGGPGKEAYNASQGVEETTTGITNEQVEEPAGSGETTGTEATSTVATSTAAGTDLSKGKELYSSTCGGCHAFKDAGTSGTAGPDLDLLKPDEAAVQKQIDNGGGAMPGGLLTGGDAKAVAAYVAAVAGK